MNDSLTSAEARIFQLAASGQKQKALQALFELIVEQARAKDFQTAERLRDRLYEIDPMALKEIISSGDIIEQEKTVAIPPRQREIWTNLQEILTPEEFTDIYHALEERSCRPEESIVTQGDASSTLFFINSGTLKASFMQGNKEVFIKTLTAGQIIGENFFNASFWTINLTALTPSNISTLQQKSLSRLTEAHPGLDEKLKDFYTKCNDIHSLLKRKGLDRRRHKRFQLLRKIQVQILDQTGKPLGREFRGELADISQGGLAYIVRISNRANARLLLGRNMRIQIPASSSSDEWQPVGMAIGVQPIHLLECDFSVHLKFNQQLSPETLQAILA